MGLFALVIRAHMIDVHSTTNTTKINKNRHRHCNKGWKCLNIYLASSAVMHSLVCNLFNQCSDLVWPMGWCLELYNPREGLSGLSVNYQRHYAIFRLLIYRYIRSVSPWVSVLLCNYSLLRYSRMELIETSKLLKSRLIAETADKA